MCNYRIKPARSSGAVLQCSLSQLSSVIVVLSRVDTCGFILILYILQPPFAFVSLSLAPSSCSLTSLPSLTSQSKQLSAVAADTMQRRCINGGSRRRRRLVVAQLVGSAAAAVASTLLAQVTAATAAAARAPTRATRSGSLSNGQWRC